MRVDHAQAILFGLALGDALGAPTEFLTLPEIRQRYGQRGIVEPPDRSHYTDDTQMTLALAEGLLDAGLAADLDAQMNAVGRRFVTWLHSPENIYAPGAACLSGARRFEAGLSWRESGDPNAKGCGAAMRVAPIGYLYQRDERRLREIAAASAQMTHGHPAAVAASVAAACAVKLALDGVPPAEYLRRLLSFTDGISAEFDAALYRVGHVLAWRDEEAALDHIGQGWVAEEAVALALYCVLRYPDDYVAAVRRAANSNGDSDSIACIAGGILGARLGLDAIPPGWRERCADAAYLRDLAERLERAAPGDG